MFYLKELIKNLTDIFEGKFKTISKMNKPSPLDDAPNSCSYCQGTGYLNVESKDNIAFSRYREFIPPSSNCYSHQKICPICKGKEITDN